MKIPPKTYIIASFRNFFINPSKISTEKQENNYRLRQCFLITGPFILTVGLGMTSGYSAILLPQLDSTNSTLKITQTEASWIASLAAFPMIFGCLFGGILMEQLGRKGAHLTTVFPSTIGWLLIAFSTQFLHLCIGRFLTGLSGGILGTCTGVYIGEISSPKLRPFLLATISLAVAFGLFFVHLLGTFLTWQTVAFISSSLPIIGLFLLLPVPESPFWLIKNHQIEKGSLIFFWLRPECDSSKKELSLLIENQLNTKESLTSKLKSITKREFLAPLFILIVFIVANQWCGVNAMTFYTVQILKKILTGEINEYIAMLIIDIIRLVMSLVACVLMQTMGRRPLALISAIGTFDSLLTITFYGFFATSMVGFSTAIPMTALISYISFITIGFVPLPWAMIGEVFPLQNRNIGASVCSFMAFTAFFSVVKTSPDLFEGLGSEGTFGVYASVAGGACIFIYFFLPETKNQTLGQIEACFIRQPRKEIDNAA